MPARPAPAPACALRLLAGVCALILALACASGHAVAETPPGWERHEAAGLAFALPPGFEPESDGDFVLSFWRGPDDMSHGSFVGAGPADPDELDSLITEIRADGFDLKQSDQPLVIDGHGFHQITAAGRIEGAFVEALILFATEPLPDGRHHRLAILSFETDPAEHRALTRDIAATITLD